MDLGNMLQKVKQMQDNMQKITEELSKEVVTTGAGRGAVVVKISGEMQVKSISIDPEIAPMNDHKKLEDLLLLAVNESILKAKALAESKIKTVSEFNLPEITNMLGKFK